MMQEPEKVLEDGTSVEYAWRTGEWLPQDHMGEAGEVQIRLTCFYSYYLNKYLALLDRVDVWPTHIMIYATSAPPFVSSIVMGMERKRFSEKEFAVFRKQALTCVMAGALDETGMRQG